MVVVILVLCDKDKVSVKGLIVWQITNFWLRSMAYFFACRTVLSLFLWYYFVQMHKTIRGWAWQNLIKYIIKCLCLTYNCNGEVITALSTLGEHWFSAFCEDPCTNSLVLYIYVLLILYIRILPNVFDFIAYFIGLCSALNLNTACSFPLKMR